VRLDYRLSPNGSPADASFAGVFEHLRSGLPLKEPFVEASNAL
jgi:hypothetical protein